ncbi:integral membrane protein GPR137C [Dunckerocampus dactyliophorus]|uniref:integral membrane protein GPR137C n=1 Tax=Dunckerocampus dactyliophorus TaxID=161453 RepID=UPI002406FE6B|nr:integral membrane protein GPR137C [Dunckerocampus dactyliophorus]
MFWSEEQVLSSGGAITPALELSLTAAYSILYALLFFFVYLQLWLVLRYGYKRCSYQTVFLFLSLLWAALRTTLFSFYFQNVAQAEQLQPLTYWLLFCCPVCLHFFTLCLLNFYFWQVMCKAKAKYSAELSKSRIGLCLLFLCVSVFFLVVNATCALLVQGALENSQLPSDRSVRHTAVAGVLINDSLFVLCAVSLAICVFRIAKMSSANVYLQSKGTSVCQATAVGALAVLLYTSRACYNLVVALSVQDGPNLCSYTWCNLSDQAMSGKAYVVFGLVLFFWEMLPTSLMVLFFRVQRPNHNLLATGIIGSGDSYFDNPRRRDSDDDLSRGINRGDRASLLPSSVHAGRVSSWFGSIQHNGTLVSTQLPPPTSTAPLLFASGNVQNPGHHHHNYYSTPQSTQQHQSYYYSTPQK